VRAYRGAAKPSSRRPLRLIQNAHQVRALGALIRYQPRLASQRRNGHHLIHTATASWTGWPVVSASSAFVRHDTGPLGWGSMSRVPPKGGTRYENVGCLLSWARS
jgi:hypothetical protein